VILLACADDELGLGPVAAVEDKPHVTCEMARTWQARFTPHRMSGMADAPPRAAPRTINGNQGNAAITLVTEKDLRQDRHGSSQPILMGAGLPQSWVSRTREASAASLALRRG
jgi:hypothetical protein